MPVKPFLTCLLTTGLLVASTPADEVDPYIPSDAQVVLTINVHQILDSELIKKHALESVWKTFMKHDDLWVAGLNAMGLDPIKDIRSITVVGFKESSLGEVFIHGRFDPAKLRTNAEERAKKDDIFRIVKENGYTFYQTLWRVYFAVVDETTIAESWDKGRIIACLDRKAGKRSGEIKGKLQALLKESDANQSMTLVALHGGLLNAAAEANDGEVEHIESIDEAMAVALVTVSGGLVTAIAHDFQEYIESVDCFRCGLNLAGDIRFSATVHGRNGQPIRDLGENLRQALESTKKELETQTEKQPFLALEIELLRFMKVTVKDQDVVLNATVADGAAEKLFKQFEGK